MKRRIFILGALGGLASPAFIAPAYASGTIHEVEIRDFEFSPKHLDVKTGDTVRFTNYDLAPHTATAVDDSWDTGDLALNQSVMIEVTENWQGEYYCAFHPVMTGIIEVHNY